MYDACTVWRGEKEHMAKKHVKRKGDSLLRDGLILCVIAAVLGLILGGVFLKTKKHIDEASKEARLTGYNNVYKDYSGVKFEESGELSAGISEYNSRKSENMKAYIDNISKAEDEQGNVIGYAFIAHSAGYSGNVTIAAGIDLSGVVTGIDIVYMNETAGLGANCTDEEFKEQFKGKSGKIGINAGTGADDNEIDGLTNATITSDAVVNSVNICLDFFNTINSATGGN